MPQVGDSFSRFEQFLDRVVEACNRIKKGDHAYIIIGRLKKPKAAQGADSACIGEMHAKT
jgi:hypothetical protein